MQTKTTQIRAKDKNKNIERFGSMMSNRMKETANAAIPTTVEFAHVNGDMSITPVSLGIPIPKGEYMVNLMLTGPKVTSEEDHSHSAGSHDGHTSGDGAHSHSGGRHRHDLPAELRGILPGDTVVIVWCNGEPVVIAIAVKS